MLTILIAESELELVPVELQNERSVRAHAKRRGKKASELILDSSLHHTAMTALTEKNRRGRPDMIHTTLLVLLESILNMDGGLRVIMHTRNDQSIEFNSTIRLPKNYNRFVGLMEQLFVSGKVPKDNIEGQEPLILLEHDRGLVDIINRLKADAGANSTGIRTVLLSDSGREVDPGQYFGEAAKSGGETLCIIGGFPEGDFKTSTDELLVDDIISIYPEPLKSWTVAAEIIVNYRSGNKTAPKQK